MEPTKDEKLIVAKVNILTDQINKEIQKWCSIDMQHHAEVSQADHMYNGRVKPIPIIVTRFYTEVVDHDN